MSRIAWWLDYIERELEPAMRVQMKSILKRSPKDQAIVDELQATKELVKASDAASAEMESDFFAQMEAQIMMKVEQAEIKDISAKEQALKGIVRKISRYRKQMGRSAALAGILMTAFYTYQFVSSHPINTKWDIHQEIAHHLQSDPSELGALMTYQSEHDFFVDVASQSLDHLTKEQFEVLMGSSKSKRKLTR